ncbi:hypothetical protein I6F26_33680 [Ensifer sp. IC3342]|nr:hypothetical protein [Ensifer sp. BRP08]MCA1451363.1 hypothetical protein [Ensifer sp. IC3342]
MVFSLREVGVGDGAAEVLADLAAADDGADRLANGGGACERLARPADPS